MMLINILFAILGSVDKLCNSCVQLYFQTNAYYTTKDKLKIQPKCTNFPSPKFFPPPHLKAQTAKDSIAFS